MDENQAEDHRGMAHRGATRPQMGGGHSGEMAMEQREQMVREHHRQTQWVYWFIVLLGAWTMASPFALGYLDPQLWVQPSGGRGVWFSNATHDALRATLTTWSDLVAGFLLIVFGWRSLRPDRAVSLWICCFVGVWLSIAPLLLWSPIPGAYLNDTLVGMLVIALSILIPGMPRMMAYMKMGGARPPGWSYNPSSWAQRALMIALAFAGLLVSRYLAAFQLGFTDQIWEPFFGSGTREVLNSEMSHAWPASDAAFGALAYTFEFLMGWMGGPARWRTMPWMVTLFGVLVIPLGLVHIFLVMSQPITVGAWCTFCLVAAAIMLPMIPLQVDEVIAMGQHMRQSTARGERFWTVFWRGGSAEGSEEDERSPAVDAVSDEPGRFLLASLWGTSAPWSLVVSATLGVWLLFVPGVFGFEGGVANAHFVAGALVVVIAVVAMAEPLRAGRFLNVIVGLAVVGAPWLFDGAPTAARVAALATGLGVAALAVPRGPVRERYGAWDRLIF